MEKSSETTTKVTITVNGSPYTFDTRDVTGLEIKTKAGLPSNSELYRKDDEHLTPVGNDQKVEIHDGEKFVAYPPTPVS